MQSRYKLVIYWSEEDKRFLAEVPELPGCMADGVSYQEAVRNVEVIMDEWIVSAREFGRTIPTPGGKLMYA
jgi:predicted RNase H-like HicB family nuclease